MKKTASLALFTLLCAVGAASTASVHVECNTRHGKCTVPVPPVPPQPPMPPAPPAPPAPPVPPPDSDGDYVSTAAMPALPALPTMPAMPTMPAIPAPPPPPKIPDVPAAAHAACADKAPGSTVTYSMGKGEYMRGVCEREDGKMAFMLRAYHKD
jgi:hypothetical protein